jgi:septation ring formation regulator EzrA
MKEDVMNDEEVTLLQEELAQARAELEGLQTTVADREARAAHLELQLAGVRDELSTAQHDVETRDTELTTLRERSDALESSVRLSAERYRALALERSPELPEELISGSTVEEIDQAIDRARETVSKVRGHLETHAQATRVPVGAPVRSGPDYSALSAEEKIARGIEQRRG